MAVDAPQKSGDSTASQNPKATPHWLIGLNVLISVVLVLLLVGGLQWLAFHFSTRTDMTAGGVNSLSDGTKKLVENLDVDIRLTSTYFTNDAEGEDQRKFRSHVSDLINLYRASNRGKIVSETVNPLQDHERWKEILQRVAEIGKFKEQAKGYQEGIDTFQGGLGSRIVELLNAEIQVVNGLPTANELDKSLVGQIQQLYDRTQQEIELAARDIEDNLAAEVPARQAAVRVIRQTYSNTLQLLNSVISVAEQLKGQSDQVSPAVAEFFVGGADRYKSVIDELSEELRRLKDLPELELDTLLNDLGMNAILVETADDAYVVQFDDIWPPRNPNAPGGGFNDRRFLGEQKITAAIARLTQKDKPAVIFVRFGGAPLFFGGFMPGQARPQYSQMKEQLEDVNFTVHEWDISTQDEMPEIDPAPSRKLFVLLRPTPPQRNPFQQQQDPGFTPDKLEKVKAALGDDVRAIFLAGYMPGMFGNASPYEYNTYLDETWGVKALADQLILQAEPIGGGKYQFRGNPVMIADCDFSDDPISEQLSQSRSILPMAVPIEIEDEAKEGVEINKLAWVEEKDGLWAIKDINYYQQQVANEYIVPNADDHTGEFPLAVTAQKGNSKIVLVSSSDFATDSVALASEMVFGSQGLTIRPRNPGNVTLFINSLHWLNDNTEWMNLGTPIDTATIAIKADSSEMTFVKLLSWIILPGFAACCGIIVSWVRRS